MNENELTSYGQLIEDARRAIPRMSQRKAAAAAGISDGWWRQVIAGVQKRGDHTVPVTASRDTLLAMAAAVKADVDAVLRAAGMDPEPPGSVFTHHGRMVASGQGFEVWVEESILGIQASVDELIERVKMLEQQSAREGASSRVTPLSDRRATVTVIDDESVAAYTPEDWEGDGGVDTFHNP